MVSCQISDSVRKCRYHGNSWPVCWPWECILCNKQSKGPYGSGPNRYRILFLCPCSSANCWSGIASPLLWYFPLKDSLQTVHDDRTHPILMSLYQGCPRIQPWQSPANQPSQSSLYCKGLLHVSRRRCTINHVKRSFSRTAPPAFALFSPERCLFSGGSKPSRT